MSQANINFSDKTKALQAILRKRKNRTVPASEAKLFPLGKEDSDASKPDEITFFSEAFSKTSERMDEEEIPEELIQAAFEEAMEDPLAEGITEDDPADEDLKDELPEIIDLIPEDPDEESVRDLAEELSAEPAETDPSFEAEEDTEKEVFREVLKEAAAETAAEDLGMFAEAYSKEEVPECMDEIAEDLEKEAFRKASLEESPVPLAAAAEIISEEYSKEELPVSGEEITEDTAKETFRENAEEEAAVPMADFAEGMTEEYPKEEPLEVIRETAEDTEKEAYRESAEEVTTPMIDFAEATAEEYSKDEPVEIPEEIPEDTEKEAVQARDFSEPGRDVQEEVMPAGKKTEKDLIREKAEAFCSKVISNLREAAETKGIQPGTVVEALYSVGLNSLMREGLFVRFLKTKNRINWDGESLADYHTVKDDRNYADELIVSIAECLKDLGLDSKFYYMYSDYNRSGDAVKEFGVYEKGHFFNENAVMEACPRGSVICAAKPGEALLIKADNQYGYQKTKLLVAVSGAVNDSGSNSPEAGKNEGVSAKAKAFAGAMNRDAQAGGKKVVEFTSFCASLLKKNGYENVAVIPAYGEYGIDIIAFRDRVKFGIQCICDAQPIGIPVIRETVSGRNYYGCHVAAVMTDGAVAEDAAEFARKNGIVLWDESVIAKFEKRTYRNCCTEI